MGRIFKAGRLLVCLPAEKNSVRLLLPACEALRRKSSEMQYLLQLSSNDWREFLSSQTAKFLGTRRKDVCKNITRGLLGCKQLRQAASSFHCIQALKPMRNTDLKSPDTNESWQDKLAPSAVAVQVEDAGKIENPKKNATRENI